MSSSRRGQTSKEDQLEQKESILDNKFEQLKYFATGKIMWTYADKDNKNDWDISTHKIRYIRKLRAALKINDMIAAIIASCGFGIAFVEYELFYEAKLLTLAQGLPEKTNNDQFILMLRACLTSSTIGLIVFLFFNSIIGYLLAKEKNKVSLDKFYFTTKYFWAFLFEAFINIIHAPPTFNYVFEISEGTGVVYSQSFDGICQTFMLFRIYQVFRLFSSFIKWRNELSEVICEDEGCEASTLFALKALMQTTPYLILIVLVIISQAFFGIALRNFERPYNDQIEGIDDNGYSLGQDWSTLINASWCVIITMTTVGYGDFFAKSAVGRLITVIIIFSGTFMVSLQVATLTNSITLDAKEGRAFNILYRLSTRELMKNKAATMIVTMIKICGLDKDFERKKANNPKEKVKEWYKEYEDTRGECMQLQDIYKCEFIETRKKLKTQSADPAEEFRKLCQQIDGDFDELKCYYLILKDIEENLESIKTSNNVVKEMIQHIITYNSVFKKELQIFKGGILTKNR